MKKILIYTMILVSLLLASSVLSSPTRLDLRLNLGTGITDGGGGPAGDGILLGAASEYGITSPGNYIVVN